MQDRVTSILPDTATWINAHRSRRPTPLVTGVLFLLRHIKEFSFLLLGPLLVSAMVGAVLFDTPFSPKEMYPLFIVQIGAIAWLLNSVLSYRMLTAKGTNFSLRHLPLRSLHGLPKPLISSVAVVLAFIGCLGLPYLLSLAVCWIWAPVFVASEAFAKVTPLPDTDEDYFDDEEEQEPEDSRVFSHMPIWSIGFYRSFVFAITNVVTTLEIIALLWFAYVAPVAFVRFVFSDPHLALTNMLETLLPVVVTGAVLMVGVGAFLHLLPKSAREELELPVSVEWESAQARSARPRPNMLVFLVALPLAVLSSWYIVHTERDARAMPATVSSESEGIRFRGDTLIWRIQIEDPAYKFRWLTPTNFRLVAHSNETQPETPESADEKKGPSQTLAAASHSAPFAPYRVEPERFYVLDAAGKSLGDRYRPVDGPVTVELRFPVTASVRRADRVALHYGVFGLLPEPYNESQLGRALAEVQVSEIPEER